MRSVLAASLPALLVGVAVVVLRGPCPAARLAAVVHGRGALRMRRLEGTPPAWAVLHRTGMRAVGLLRRPASDDATVRAVIEGWARQLRSGGPAAAGLLDAIGDLPRAGPLLPRTCAALAVGGEVADALRADAATVTGDVARRALQAMAACWVVAERNGGRLAAALDRVADGVRADQQHVAHVRSELAGARASARLLAALPAFALFLAAGLGMNPIGVLLRDPVGRAALVCGLALDVVGLLWTSRIARTAERWG